MPRIELQATDSPAFEAWPKGDFVFRVLQVEQALSKKENQQLRFKLECGEGAYEGKKQTAFVTITEKGGWDLGRYLEACIPGKYEAEAIGEKDGDGNQKKLYSFDTDDFVDTYVLLTNNPEPYNGAMTNRWNNPRPYGVAYEGGEQQAAGDAGAGPAQPQAAEDALQQPAQGGEQERTAAPRRRLAAT